MVNIIIGILVAIGLYDLYLAYKGKETLSQRAEALLPQWADVAIVAATLAGVWWLCGGPMTFLKALFFVLLGHMFLGHERYKK